MRKLPSLLFGALLASGCGAGEGPAAHDPAIHKSATDALIAGLRPAHLSTTTELDAIDKAIANHFERSATSRGYMMTDKPLYQPGETIWLRADLRSTGTLLGAKTPSLTIQLVSPRGAIVSAQQAQLVDGVAQAAFDLDPSIEGGEYTLQLTAADGTTDARKIIVNTYEAPRLQKTVEWVRKAYGAGDTVAAAIEIKRATGEPFGGKTVTGVVTIDDQEVARLPIATDAEGKAVAKFQLPSAISRGDGLLTILVEDGGVTESIQKRIPIVMKTLSFAMFPEGGDLIAGVPGRVYFSAKNTLGKPADIEGRVLDDRGNEIGKLSSVHDGLGRFELTPQTDRSYKVQITKPAGIAQTFAVPAAKDGGCALRAVDQQTLDKLRVAATCSTSRTLLVEAVLREKRLGGGAVDVQAGQPALIELPVDAEAQGAVRVTLFSRKQEPLAERLIYHSRGQDLHVALTADRTSYSPRDPVKLHVHTTDAAGKPVKADVGVAVVDDTVLTFADDKSSRILAHLYLDPELHATADDPIEEPGFYFSKKPEAAAGLDALLATRGYRRFEWEPVLHPPLPVATATDMAAPMEMEGAMPPPPPAAAAPVANRAPDHARRPAFKKAGGELAAEKPKAIAPTTPARPEVVAHAMKHELKELRELKPMAKADFAGRAQMIGKDEDGDIGDDKTIAWAPVRVFPVPQYTKAYDGPRTDFRETIFWNPNVATDSHGDATVAFVTSDAVTSFRATAEGVSAGGVPGSGEATFASKLPVTLDAHLPLEVSSGDEIRLPVTLSNETDDAIDAELGATFGAAFKLEADPVAGHKIHLAAGEKKSLVFPLKVVAQDGSGHIELAMEARGLKDDLAKDIRVAPLGFPFQTSASGTAKSGELARQEFAIDDALPGSIRATVTMYPSPVAAMTDGMAGMIREPGGCFEQTSSTNYPNIMILSYLGANDAADAQLMAKTSTTLDKGYKLLTGYETPQKGYEWFGHTPGHEALTAYGLMEFADMAKVYDVDPAMVERTANWLMSRRDGKGGFRRSQEAVDSFGRASEALTNAYIMWALSEAKRTAGLDPELATSRALGASTTDPYLLALVTNTALITAPKAPETAAMVRKLAAMQAKDGSFPGAKESITMSGGESLTIETTALATLALIKASPANEFEPNIRGAVDWVNARRGSYGQWGNTQATILGLKALTAYADHARQMQAGGSATLIVNGHEAGTIAFDKGRKDALVWNDLAGALHTGKNTIELRLEGGATLPYTVSIDYRSARPQSSAKAKVSVATTLDKDHVKMGEGVKLRAHIENRTADGIPMTLARVGLPGGLVTQTWQLKELKDKGLIDFYETRPREVILYWRGMAPTAKKDIDLDLLAAVPGDYEAPASSAYLYYTAEDKAWAPPLKVSVAK